MWHSLGTILSDYPTRDEAKAIAHPWEPVTEPLFRREYGFDPETGEPMTTFVEVETHQALVRDDNNFLLGVNSNTYEHVSNAELYDIAEALEQGADGEVMYETGGSLSGGKKVWLMLRLREPLTVPGDPNGAHVPYYSLQNAHDGSGSFRGQATMIRVVCANTAHMADLDAAQRGTEFMFKHTKNVKDRIEEARNALAGWREGLTNWQLQMQELISTEVTPAGIEFFIDKFIPAPPAGLASERVLANVANAHADLRSLFVGETMEGIGGTAYGLIAAASEWSEWQRKAKTPETRFRRSVLDRNDVITTATKWAREAALV
jgi:phage/plasmid-like protein (TIGR03299 family)